VHGSSRPRTFDQAEHSESMMNLTRGISAAVGIAILLMTPSTAASHQRADLRGRVSDASGQPILGAEVSLPALGRMTTSSDSGAFRLSGLPGGRQELRVRRLGFEEFIDFIILPDAGTVERSVRLLAIPKLTPVDVTAIATLTSFEEHRKLGLGKFVSREELAKRDQGRLPDVLATMGVRVIRSGQRAWLGSSRMHIRNMDPDGGAMKCATLEGVAVPSQFQDDPRRNPGCGSCFAQIYVDDALLYNGDQSGVVPDLGQIPVHSIEAIEYYRGPAQTPMKYSRLNSACGVLVVHTRRTVPEKPPSE